MGSEATKIVDGRQHRTTRSRTAICEACLDLVEEGVLRPSADEIAERAGVSRRSIFNHFGDLAELYDAVVEVGLERCAPLLEEIPSDQPVSLRVDQVVRIRSRFLEAMAPFTRALTAQALVGPASDQARRISKEATRFQQANIERLFQKELARLDPIDRAETLESISASMAPLLWETLRRNRGLSAARARAVMKRMLEAILRDALGDAWR